jgi:NAD(P)-dependent dehydrogenase (short-subunit alcohol dehydrogenase family)
MADLSLFDLTGKKALVTGAAVGIGRGCAVALARAGADVAIVDINHEAGAKTADEIRSLGRQSLFVPCDVSRRDQVQEMVRRVVERFGRLDIAVNNAGLGILGADEDPQAWDKVIAVNLTGVFLCAQAEAQQMLRQQPIEGKIINIASMSATICNCNASYNASKAGVVQMTRMLAAEWGRYNINVNCISPSYVLTPMHASTPVVVRQRIRELTPLGHVQRPEDLHGAVIFLASAASNYGSRLDGRRRAHAQRVAHSAFAPRAAPRESRGGDGSTETRPRHARTDLRRRWDQPARPSRDRRRLQGRLWNPGVRSRP